MKIQSKYFTEKTCDHKRTSDPKVLYQLSSWGADHWMCADCFIKVLQIRQADIKFKDGYK